MPGSTFGSVFRVTTAGESHGPANLVIVDGVPAGLPLIIEEINRDLARRRPGQSDLVTQRSESDRPQILSGLFDGVTTGTPLAILIPNEDAQSKDYDQLKDVYRPGHGDYTFEARFGVRDHRGGGRSSARETVARVAAGAVARAFLGKAFGIEVVGWVNQVGDVRVPDDVDLGGVRHDRVEATPVRCPHEQTARRMATVIEEVRDEGDSIGGVAGFVARGVPAGWGEPVFDKLKADLGKALFSLPAVMGVEYGAGFAVAESRGSENNDPFVQVGGEVQTSSNRHGGMLGGISSGMLIRLRVAVKPPSSIGKPQETVAKDGSAKQISVSGRHDPCVLPRFVPMGEAMVLLVLADHALRARLAR